LQEYANKYFTKPDENIQFKYYQTRSNEIMELEMNAFSICKGLLARLYPRNKPPKKSFPHNEWYLIVQSGSVLTKENVKLKLEPSISSKFLWHILLCHCLTETMIPLRLNSNQVEKNQSKCWYIAVDTLSTLGSLFSSIPPYRVLVRDSGM
jgi:hypothetical protein